MRNVAMLILVLALGACGSLRWPWSPAPAAVPEIVHELTLQGGQVPQVWEGNVLVLDLSGVSSSGSLVATPTYDRGWPLRMSVRTFPGRFGALEAKGAQRAVIPLTTEGAAPVDLAIPPEVFAKGTPQVTFNWGASISPPVIFPQAPPPAPAPVGASLPANR